MLAMSFAISLDHPLHFPAFITEVKVKAKITATSQTSEDSLRVTDSIGVGGVV